MQRIQIPELRTFYVSFANLYFFPQLCSVFWFFFQVMSYASLTSPTLSPPTSILRSSPSSSSSHEVPPGPSLFFHLLHPNYSQGRHFHVPGEAWICSLHEIPPLLYWFWPSSTPTSGIAKGVFSLSQLINLSQCGQNYCSTTEISSCPFLLKIPQGP